MGIAAEAVLALTQPPFESQVALRVLDIICEQWRGCDAEFEAEDPKRPGCDNPEYISYTDFQAPLGKLIAMAFSPGMEWKLDNPPSDHEEDPVWQRWYDGPYKQFHDRYEFC